MIRERREWIYEFKARFSKPPDNLDKFYDKDKLQKPLTAEEKLQEKLEKEQKKKDKEKKKKDKGKGNKGKGKRKTRTTPRMPPS